MPRILSRMPHTLGLLSALACAALVGGCASDPGAMPPADRGTSGYPEWNPTPSQLAHYELTERRGGKMLSLRYASQMPFSLGETFVSDLTILVKNPRVGEYVLPHEDVLVTLFRSSEVANKRTGPIDLTRGWLTLEAEVEGGFEGHVKAQFDDELNGGERYQCLVRFSPPDRVR
jgi:hypothetical protein